MIKNLPSDPKQFLSCLTAAYQDLSTKDANFYFAGAGFTGLFNKIYSATNPSIMKQIFHDYASHRYKKDFDGSSLDFISFTSHLESFYKTKLPNSGNFETRHSISASLDFLEGFCEKGSPYYQSNTILYTGLFAAGAASAVAIHYLAKDKIENPYKRAAVSIAIAGAAVLAGYALVS